VSHSFVDLIIAKRDGHSLDDGAITWALEQHVAGHVPDEQMSALLMAILFRGLNDQELGTWTDAMVRSGERLDLRQLRRPTVDKHSTGGVGDKLSLIITPLVAAFGAAVPKLSGRGLGHTGGTIDKLDAIPGWRASMSNEAIVAQLENIGAVICAAGANLAPADKKLYALRDVTGTVESIPLIASSIMSKKIAGGTNALVLDVKVGRGAFMKDLDTARRLAETMVALGSRYGVATVAHITSMDQPLGRASGNALEVIEAVEVLRGGGPADVRELSVAFATTMLRLVGISADPATALDDGRAYEVFCAMIAVQGGDPEAKLPIGEQRDVVTAPRAGYVTRVDALEVGVATWRLGAGRARKEDDVSPGAGTICLVREGDYVEEGQALFELFADDESHLLRGRGVLEKAFVLGDQPPLPQALILDTLGA
jgi:thymidine phosphorylase